MMSYNWLYLFLDTSCSYKTLSEHLQNNDLKYLLDLVDNNYIIIFVSGFISTTEPWLLINT